MDRKPELTFFCELEGKQLKKLFEDRFVLDDLMILRAGVSLGIIDFSKERTQVVQTLSRLGIPVSAWLLLPRDDGYWFNLDNYPQAIARYEEFKKWSQENKLSWHSIGLDIEPDINQIQAFLRKEKASFLPMFRRLKDMNSFKSATLAYTGLVNKIHDDGYEVETYHLPIIIDDRKAKTSILKRTIGLVDIPVDREILMLYSSGIRPYGQAVLWQYAKDADAIGIGNTGGGVNLDTSEPLTWEEFSSDLRLAWRTGKPIYVFSLEGCIRQGFLDRLTTFDWNARIDLPRSGLVKAARSGLHGLLWMAQRPFVILAGVISIIGGYRYFSQHKPKK